MQRRKFLKASGQAALVSCLPLSCLQFSEDKKYKFGYQLYSIRDEMEKKPLETLAFLKELGYEDFEHYGFNPEDGSYYGYDAKAFKNKLDDLGLTISSGHYPFSQFLNAPESELMEYTKRAIEGAKIMGSKYLVWPWLDPEQRTVDSFKKAASKLNSIGELMKAAGLVMTYHNNGYDFNPLGNADGYEIILNETDPDLVKLQIDFYWVANAGTRNPVELLAANPDRFVMWHIKDMHKESRDYTELGNGSIDYVSIIPQLNQSHLDYYFIEQGGNFTVNSKESAAFSAQYFKKHLQEFL
ncbi:MAG: sugar phosphate isomerase/epimerase family protein [bacterium]